MGYVKCRNDTFTPYVNVLTASTRHFVCEKRAFSHVLFPSSSSRARLITDDDELQH